jgi:hypothetical protein
VFQAENAALILTSRVIFDRIRFGRTDSTTKYNMLIQDNKKWRGLRGFGKNKIKTGRYAAKKRENKNGKRKEK